MITYWRQGVAVLMAFATPHVAVCNAGTQPEVDRIIDGVIARSSVIYSIEIQYDYTLETVIEARTRSADVDQLTLVVEGEDWMVRYMDSENFRMNRNQTMATYYAATAPDQEVRRALHLEGGYSLGRLMAENTRFCASRLGTLWFGRQATFLDENRSRISRANDVMLDGVSTNVIEIPIRAQDFSSGLVVIPPRVARGGAGFLKIYAAESLGWAVPRIEYLDRHRNVCRRFEAKSFDEVAEGVFFPRSASCELLSEKGRRLSGFVVHKVRFANEPVPPAVFEVSVPPGTHVRDSRPGTANSVFELESADQNRSINVAVGNDLVVKRPASARNVLLLTNLSILLVAIGYWGVTRCRNQR